MYIYVHTRVHVWIISCVSLSPTLLEWGPNLEAAGMGQKVMPAGEVSCELKLSNLQCVATGAGIYVTIPPSPPPPPKKKEKYIYKDIYK